MSLDYTNYDPSEMEVVGSFGVPDQKIHRNERGDEFFPLSWDEHESVRKAYANLRKRSYRAEVNTKDCRQNGPIPARLYRLTCQEAGGSETWNRGGQRNIWWGQIISGERGIRWTPCGPGGYPGIWVEGSASAGASRKDWSDRT